MAEQQNQTQTTINPNDLSASELKETIEQSTHTPADAAAAFFSLEYPRFRGMLNTLSHNELIRVCLNLAGNEFVPEQNKLKSDKERSAFYLGDQMIFNRSIMRLQLEMERAEQAQKMLDQNEKQQETKEENNNGTN